MKTTVKELQNRNAYLESQIEAIYLAGTVKQNRELIHALNDEIKRNEDEIRAITNFNVKVGDGITLNYYSDSHAYTIISRTNKTITIQRDKATLNKNFKPEFIPGGFAGRCINQEEQTYTYERDEEGRTLTLRWSNKYGRFVCKEARVSNGRHEFYDYNF